VLALTVKKDKDGCEWIYIDTGYEIIKVTAKKTNGKGRTTIIFDAPPSIKIWHESNNEEKD